MIVWAVARQMIAECIRMKIALVFVVLLVLIVLGLPFSIEGDSSMAGAVQAFLSYSLTAISVLLGILTIFLSRSLSDELVNRQILLLVSKPVARWQYILGKWVGMSLFNVSFVLFSGVAVWGMVQYLAATRAPLDPLYDEKELHNEVLVARHVSKFNVPDYTQEAEREYQLRLEQGVYNDVLDFDEKREKKRLLGLFDARWRVVPPLDARVFEFENVLCDRSPQSQVQVRYKTEVTNYPPDEIFRALWIFGNPDKGTKQYAYPVRHVVGRYHTMAFPADAVAADYTLTVRFENRNVFPNEPQFRNLIEFQTAEGVEVLFVVGSFEGNLARLLVLVLCKLMLLSAVSLLATTVFSFPVAALVSFSFYALAGCSAFIWDSLKFASDDFATWFSSAKEFVLHLIAWLYKTLGYVIPNFAQYDAVETLVNGRNVSLTWVMLGIANLVLLRTVVALGLAMLLFHRREVSEVSV